MWPLREGVKFGIASDYEDLVFHNFQARLSDTDLLVKNPRVNYFINKWQKCMAIIYLYTMDKQNLSKVNNIYL